MKVIISAAGTAGHINPGVAIANKIRKENNKAQIVFIGTNRGLENDLIPRAGYELKTINAYGLSKKLSIQSIKNNIKTIKGILEADKIIKEFNPDIVIGTGGYICGPVFVAARKNHIPTMLHESNAFPGVAVKMLAKKTNTILLGFEDAKKRITKCNNVIVTGTPVQIKDLKLSKLEKDGIKKKLGLDIELPTVLVFGGSQGAKNINNTLIEIIKQKMCKDFQIIWATGAKQYDVVKQELSDDGININNIKNIKIVSYIYNMEEIMNIADVVVCRSGAMTITEIAKLGKPSILIPLPNVSQNHQEYNAKVLENVCASKMILDKDITAKVLNLAIIDIVKDEKKMKSMGEKAKIISIPNVEEKIYNEVKKLVKT